MEHGLGIYYYTVYILNVQFEKCVHIHLKFINSKLLPHLAPGKRYAPGTQVKKVYTVQCFGNKLHYMLLDGVICPFVRTLFLSVEKYFIAKCYKMKFPTVFHCPFAILPVKAGRLYSVFTMSIAKLLISPFLYI